MKYSSVFRENRCPPPPKPVYGGNFNHEVVTLKIRSRSQKSNKLLILSDLLACKFGIIPSKGPWDNMQTNTFWLNFGALSLTVTLKIRSRSPKPIQIFIMQICLKFPGWSMRYCAHKHLLAQIWQFKPRTDLENRSWSTKLNQLFVMYQCYIHANLFEICQPVHEIWCPRAFLGLKFDRSRSPKPIQIFIMQICLKSAGWSMRYCAHKHLLA